MAFSLIPKNDAYFEDFDTAIRLVRDISRTLRDGVEQPRIPEDLWRRIRAIEEEADSITARCLSRLENSFVTPIEREDIHLLAVTLDDVGDALEKAANRLDMFDIVEPNEDLRALAAGMDEMVEQLVICIQALRTLKPAVVRDAVNQVNVLEERIDHIFREAQRKLFARRPEAYDLVRWKEVYDYLEHASNEGKRVARTVNHILVRHS